MSFFSSDPEAPEPEEHREPYERQPSWRAPSDDELGRPLAESFVLARTDSVAVVVQGVRVHGDGCLFDIRWVLRRTDETARQWRDASDVVFGHRLGRDEDERALLLGVALSDGTTARTTDHFRWQDPPAGPRLVNAGGSGSSGGTERIHGSMQLWLTPIPPAPSMDLVCAWPRFGLTETHHTLDTRAFDEAANAAHLIWPEDAGLPVANHE